MNQNGDDWPIDFAERLAIEEFDKKSAVSKIHTPPTNARSDGGTNSRPGSFTPALRACSRTCSRVSPLATILRPSSSQAIHFPPYSAPTGSGSGCCDRCFIVLRALRMNCSSLLAKRQHKSPPDGRPASACFARRLESARPSWARLLPVERLLWTTLNANTSSARCKNPAGCWAV